MDHCHDARVTCMVFSKIYVISLLLLLEGTVTSTLAGGQRNTVPSVLPVQVRIDDAAVPPRVGLTDSPVRNVPSMSHALVRSYHVGTGLPTHSDQGSSFPDRIVRRRTDSPQTIVLDINFNIRVNSSLDNNSA